AGERSGYVYARHGNPTVTALEQAVAALEGGEAALAFASGMAAVHAALLALGARAGTTVLAARDIYGATYTLLNDLMRTQGVTTHFIDTNDLALLETTCAELEPVILLVETISNPLLKIADLSALAQIAHRHGAALLVDHTFATPCLAQPLKLGADVLVHSSTKYLGGHGDVLSGIAVTSQARWEDMYAILKATGANLGPQEAWLVLRGIKTLPLRFRQHCENALAVARWLERHPRVARVYYPGLSSHPQHALAQRQFEGHGYGGMLAFDLADAGQREVFQFFENLTLCQPATTLGDVYTLVMYPPHASHRGLSAEERAHVGIGEGLVRISVGIETVEDIVEDLGQALERANQCH
ncbi:MAG TPA: aminotransferase class I/II-fold pyridoxal phosphate-dependent enzyme, partial [Chloroflexi bacterium]|nr:aminotransferase class I/II-fold pyridoxal phosphate-dependent enzyme [Chloroflexota bacterium]